MTKEQKQARAELEEAKTNEAVAINEYGVCSDQDNSAKIRRRAAECKVAVVDDYAMNDAAMREEVAKQSSGGEPAKDCNGCMAFAAHLIKENGDLKKQIAELQARVEKSEPAKDCNVCMAFATERSWWENHLQAHRLEAAGLKVDCEDREGE